MSAERNKILQEIRLIPDDKLPELYTILHYFRMGVQSSQKEPESILKYAGSWSDLPEEISDSIVQEAYRRRNTAFSRRRNRENSTD